MKSKELKSFYRKIRQLLPCSGKMKRSLMESIHTTVESYLQEHPNADMAEIEAAIGTPGGIATACVENTGTEIILKKLLVRRRILTIITSAILVAFILWIAALLYMIQDAHNATHGTGTYSDIIVISEGVLEDDSIETTIP